MSKSCITYKQYKPTSILLSTWIWLSSLYCIWWVLSIRQLSSEAEPPTKLWLGWQDMGSHPISLPFPLPSSRSGNATKCLGSRQASRESRWAQTDFHKHWWLLRLSRTSVFSVSVLFTNSSEGGRQREFCPLLSLFHTQFSLTFIINYIYLWTWTCK